MTDPDDLDMLAAEYVLGTLDADERASVAERLPADAALARAVAEWHERLSPLTRVVAEIAPPPAVYAGIVTRLFGAPGRLASATAAGPTVSLRRLRRWQAAAGGFGLLAASLLGWIAVQDRIPTDRPRLTAVLQRDAGSPAMVVDVDLRTRLLTIRPVSAASPAGHDYELWIVDPAIGSPRSLGLVPQRSETQASLLGIAPGIITDATYAITVEPAGGSPTGQPTTAPILSGKLFAAPQ